MTDRPAHDCLVARYPAAAAMLAKPAPAVAAVHEAGHAVVVYSVGWRLAAGGVWINGGDGRTTHDASMIDITVEACLPVSLSGFVAENRMFRTGERMSADKSRLRSILARERSGDKPTGDEAGAIRYILAGTDDPLIDNEVLAEFERWEATTNRLVRDPVIWPAILRVAEALTAAKKLSAIEVEAILADPGRRALVGAWCRAMAD